MAALFDLFASVILDLTEFSTDVESAKTDVKSIGDEIDDLSDREPDMSKFTQTVSAAAEKAGDSVADVGSSLDDVQEASGATKAVIDGFADATQEVIQEVIEGLIEFGKEAVEIAAQSGSDIAEEYRRVTDRMDYATENLQLAVGQLILHPLTALKELYVSLLSSEVLYVWDHIETALDALDSYAFENLGIAREKVENFFEVFENVKINAPESIGDLTSALESQIEYWQTYSETLASLQSKNIDPNLLAQLADGTADGLSQMLAIDAASPDELEALMTAYENVLSAQSEAAVAMSDAQLAVDETFQGAMDSIAEFAAATDQSSTVQTNTAVTLRVISSTMETEYPTISSWVDLINAKIASLGQVEISMPSISTSAPGHATGLDYVPYDNYTARLHEGEAVLTKLEATRWRNGESLSPSRNPVNSGATINQYISAVPQTAQEFAQEVLWALETARFSV